MKRKVWIFNHHANSMFFDNGGRHYSFAKYLKRKGYEPVIFCSNAKHGLGELYFDDLDIWKECINENINVPFVFVKGRPYVGNGKNRILCMVDYYRNIKKTAKEYSEKHGKPDVIIGSQVHPLAVLAAEQIAKKFSIKVIAEFRDLWPESFVSYGLATKKSIIVKVLRGFEHELYKKADTIIFTMEGGYDYVIERRWQNEVPRNKVENINNGVDLANFNQNKKCYQIDDEDLDNFDVFKVVYTGSIRKVNNIGRLLDIAKAIKSPNIKFLIWGDGDEKERLEKRVIDEKITNVSFKGHIDKKYIPYITSKANLNIVHNNPSAILRFGISFNKIFDYMAAGKPILVDFPCKYNPAEKYKSTINPKSYLFLDLADTIECCARMEEVKYNELCNNSIIASKNYDFYVLTDKLIQIIES